MLYTQPQCYIGDRSATLRYVHVVIVLCLNQLLTWHPTLKLRWKGWEESTRKAEETALQRFLKVRTSISSCYTGGLLGDSQTVSCMLHSSSSSKLGSSLNQLKHCHECYMKSIARKEWVRDKYSTKQSLTYYFLECHFMVSLLSTGRNQSVVKVSVLLFGVMYSNRYSSKKSKRIYLYSSICTLFI